MSVVTRSELCNLAYQELPKMRTLKDFLEMIDEKDLADTIALSIEIIERFIDEDYMAERLK